MGAHSRYGNPKTSDAHSQPPREYKLAGASRRTDYADSKGFRYPVDNEKHVRAAISYFSQPKNNSKYPPAERARVWGRIKSAAKKFGIDVEAQPVKKSETGPESEALFKSFIVNEYGPPPILWLGYHVNTGPAAENPYAVGSMPGLPDMPVVLGADMALEGSAPYPMTWVFELADISYSDVQASGIYGQDPSNPGGAPVAGPHVTYALAMGFDNVDKATEAMTKSLEPKYQIRDVGWEVGGCDEPCPHKLYCSLQTGRTMVEIGPQSPHRCDYLAKSESATPDRDRTDPDDPTSGPDTSPKAKTAGSPPDDLSEPHAGNTLYAGMTGEDGAAPMFKGHNFRDGSTSPGDSEPADVFEEMAKSLQDLDRTTRGLPPLQKSVVDASSPFPQQVGDGDFDKDDTESGMSVPTIPQWPSADRAWINLAGEPTDPIEYFQSMGIDMGDVGAVPTPPGATQGPQWTSNPSPEVSPDPNSPVAMGTGAFWPGNQATVLETYMAKAMTLCKSCNAPNAGAFDGTPAGFCASCGSTMHMAVGHGEFMPVT